MSTTSSLTHTASRFGRVSLPSSINVVFARGEVRLSFSEDGRTLGSNLPLFCCSSCCLTGKNEVWTLWALAYLPRVRLSAKPKEWKIVRPRLAVVNTLYLICVTCMRPCYLLHYIYEINKRPRRSKLSKRMSLL